MTVSDAPTTPTAVPAVWGNVPSRNKNFTGRVDILERLHVAATSNVTAVLPGEPLPHALQGLGGVGKTAVAIEFAHRFRSNYDLVWWVPSDQVALVRSSLAALAGRLGLEAATAAGIEGATTAVLDALRRGEPYRRWLLIFDNADQPEELREYIPEGPGEVLITSRNHRWLSYYDTVQLDVFTRDESKQFLINRVPKVLDQAEADQLAEKLGDLPLALEQAGAMLAETGMAVDEYIRLLDEHVKQIMAEGRPAEYPLSMTAAWELSVFALREQLPQALELLRCCAFFGPDPIPRDVFRRGAQAVGTQISDLIANPILLARAIRELGRFALVKIEGRTISVHRLIQALLRDDLDRETQDKYRHEVHVILAAGSPGDPSDSRLWPRYDEILAHVASVTTELPRCEDPAVRRFVRDVLRYLYVSGDFASCLTFAERFIAQWTEDSGPDDPDVLHAQRHYTNALRDAGKYSMAYELVQETLERANAKLGPRDPLTLSLRNGLGADLRARGDFAAALTLNKETLALHEGLFGEADPQTLRVMNNVAIDYSLNSDFLAARRLQERIHVLQSSAGAAVSPREVLTVWTGLAEAARLCGNYSEARDVSEDALDFGRENLGAEHFMTLRAVVTLSIALRRAAAYDDALETANEVYGVAARLLGDNHPVTMAAAITLTNVLRATGEIKKALELVETTVARYPGVFGEDHPYSYGCVGNLAVLQRVSGNPAAARRLNESALTGLDARVGRDHHYSLVVAINLASDLAALNETSTARALGEDTRARLTALLGEQHPLTLGCAANLAIDLRADGATEEADRLQETTMRQYAETVGADHPDARVAATGGRLDLDFDAPPL